ncbi:MAG: lipopolysaccharide assembly protein LapA domain-containing protein [Bacillota bacterium]|nr:lipopolysaccharide assembly protein LapA domain-containing protein [Bacillota bacterium]
MRTLFIILMVLAAIVIVTVALLNTEAVTINYLLGQITLTLSMLIIGSALAGVLVMIFFMVYRSIQNYIKAEGARSLKRELQTRVKTLESEKRTMEDELNKLHKERELAAEKSRVELETAKKKLEEELTRQQKEREDAEAKEKAELELEKSKLEEELKKQQDNQQQSETVQTDDTPKKKGFFDFLKK